MNVETDDITKIITEISVTPVRPRDSLLAFCSFVFRNEIFLGDVALHINPSGVYSLRFQSKTLFNGVHCQVHYPLTEKIAEIIKQAIVARYEQMIRN